MERSKGLGTRSIYELANQRLKLLRRRKAVKLPLIMYNCN
jgi:hypothetical protein